MNQQAASYYKAASYYTSLYMSQMQNFLGKQETDWREDVVHCPSFGIMSWLPV